MRTSERLYTPIYSVFFLPPQLVPVVLLPFSWMFSASFFQLPPAGGAYYSRSLGCQEQPIAMQGFTEDMQEELYEMLREETTPGFANFWRFFFLALTYGKTVLCLFFWLCFYFCLRQKHWPYYFRSLLGFFLGFNGNHSYNRLRTHQNSVEESNHLFLFCFSDDFLF